MSRFPFFEIGGAEITLIEVPSPTEILDINAILTSLLPDGLTDTIIGKYITDAIFAEITPFIESLKLKVKYVITDFPELVTGLSDVTVRSVLMHLAVDPLFGATLENRWHTIKLFLTIAGHESGLNSDSLNTSGACGLLQWLKQPYYSSSVASGLKLISRDPLLEQLYDYHVLQMEAKYASEVKFLTWPTSKYDVYQYPAVIGRLWILSSIIGRDFRWDDKLGFVTKAPHAIDTNVGMIYKSYPAIMKDKALGGQLLMTFYNCYSYGLDLKTFPYPERLKKDLKKYIELSRADSLAASIGKIIPMLAKVARLFSTVSKFKSLW